MFLIFPLCVLLVYGVLAAQYESWSLPLTVILIVPMTLLSAIAGVWLTGGDNNVFTQISFLVLAGLACKNAILIVEFARQREARGRDRVGPRFSTPAAIRLRPVLMTSVAFIMGVVPLVFSPPAPAPKSARRWASRSSPACSASRRSACSSRRSSTSSSRDWQSAVVASRRSCRAASGDASGGPLIVSRANLSPRPSNRVRRVLLAAVVALRSVACAARTAPPPASIDPATAPSRWDASAFSDQPYDPRWWRQFDDPVLDAARGCRARRQSRRAVGGRPRRPGARGVRRGSARPLSDGHRRRLRRRARPGPCPASPTSRCDINTYRAGFDAFWELDLFGRVRAGDRGRVGQRPELRGRARRRPRQRRRRCGAQLLRAARPAAAAVGRSSAAWPTSARRCG